MSFYLRNSKLFHEFFSLRNSKLFKSFEFKAPLEAPPCGGLFEKRAQTSYILKISKYEAFFLTKFLSGLFFSGGQV
jgi:hypothetical protein